MSEKAQDIVDEVEEDDSANIEADSRRIELAGDHLNAARFLEQHRRGLRRVPELGRWYVWTGSWWEEDRNDYVLQLATKTIDDLRKWVAAAPKDDEGKEFKRRLAHYQASARASRRDALLAIAGTDPDVVVGVDQLDAHPQLLACRNGTVDLATGELRRPRRSDMLTRGIHVDFDPDAFSEKWTAFLDRTFAADVELISYVQRLLGYCLTGIVHEHVLPVLTGVGANGKSTLIGVVQDLLGEHAVTAPEGLVIRRDHHEPHPERLAVLRGRRLVVSAELEQRAVLAEAIVKMLTGGETISARELYGRRFDFRPSHKVILVTNHRPRVHGTDHAIWRRLRVVPFESVIPQNEQDPTLRRQLVEDDGPAVLAWLVQGAVEWHKQGLGEAEAVVLATEEYRTSEDSLATFLEERTVEVDRARTKVGELFDAWREWCDRTGERPGRRQDFTAALEEHGIEVDSYKHNRLARGIALAVRTGEDSPQTSLNYPSRGTLGGSAHQSSPELFDGAS